MLPKPIWLEGRQVFMIDQTKLPVELDVIEIPTNRPMARLDHSDVVYKTAAGKYRAIVEKIRECHEKGQPVLVGTVSIDKSEYLSRLLKKEKIPHSVLNAKHHLREAEIVAQAGSFGAVTISTNMAGRGTDIKLGGNPEFMAKEQLRREDFDEEMIAAAKAAHAHSFIKRMEKGYDTLLSEHGALSEGQNIVIFSCFIINFIS